MHIERKDDALAESREQTAPILTIPRSLPAENVLRQGLSKKNVAAEK